MASNNDSVRFFMVESGIVSVVCSDSDGKTTTKISEDKLYRAYYSCRFGPANARPVLRRLFRQPMRELATERKFEMVEKERSWRDRGVVQVSHTCGQSDHVGISLKLARLLVKEFEIVEEGKSETIPNWREVLIFPEEGLQ